MKAASETATPSAAIGEMLEIREQLGVHELDVGQETLVEDAVGELQLGEGVGVEGAHGGKLAHEPPMATVR